MIRLLRHDVEVTSESIGLLVGALEAGDALPSLKTLIASFPATPGAAISKLAQAFRGGCAPLLEHFDVRFDGLTQDVSNLLADMLEARARIPGCRIEDV